MNDYIATLQDINTTISDFELFCQYLQENRTKLTKVREELGKKDCFAINTLLSRPRELDGPKYLQPSYPTINLFFHIIMKTGLFKIEYGRGNSQYLIPSPKFEKYQNLSMFNKYMFLFKTYWTKLNFEELYYDSLTMFHHFMYTKLAFEVLSKAEPGVKIFADVENFNTGYDRTNPIHRLFVGVGLVVHHLCNFGFWEYQEAHIPILNVSKKDIKVKAVVPTFLGIAMIKACRSRPYELFNEKSNELFIERNWSDNHFKAIITKLGIKRPSPQTKKEPFEKAFEKLFPEGAIDAKAIDDVLRVEEDKLAAVAAGNTYIFKVSLDRKTWRRIKLSSAHSLQHLHQAIQDAFDFYDDHLYAFFMDGKPWSENVYWDKRCDDKPSADKAVIGKLGLVPGKQFLYLFDFGDEWRFNVQLEEILDSKVNPIRATVIEEKGESPQQYPDWDE